MNILHINTSFSQGGAALSAFNINAICRDNIPDVTMLCARDTANVEKGIISIGETVFRRHINALAYRLLGIEGFANKKLWEPVLSILDDFDLIHLHNVHGYYMPMTVLEEILSRTCVWTLHDYWIVTGGPGSPSPLLANRTKLDQLLPFSNLRYPVEWIDRSKQRRQQLFILLQRYNQTSLVAVSKTMSDSLISMGLKSTNLTVIPHGLFDSELGPTPASRMEARLRMGWPVTKHIFIFCAVDVDNISKGCDLFLDALNELSSTNSWVAYIFGDRSKNAKRKAKRLNLDNVHFYGKVSEIEMRESFRACDTYVTPTLNETFGRTVVEAIAEGANVVCSDLPVLREVSCGMANYFPPGNYIALREILQLLLNGVTCSCWQENANIIRQKYLKKIMGQKYVELYGSAIKRKESY